jgi:uncharacterized protein (DUF58 family)
MITLIIFLIVAFILVIEGVSLWGNSRPLRVEFDLDSTLVEPGETTTLRCSVHNPNRLPMLFVGLTLHFEPEVTVHADTGYRRALVSRSSAGTRADHRFFLPARSSFSTRLRLSLSRRGLQELGRYFIETGDYLGLYPIIRSDVIDKKVVCTSGKCEAEELSLLGGEMGEASVRRFILDDPTMLLGYRDYTGREPMKQISWMQTAKTGQLTVRQNDFTVERNVSVLVNMESAPLPVLEHCMELLRSVCEELEAQRVPYALFTNGDVFSVNEGLGRNHVLYIQRRIGLSRLICYLSFSRLVDQYVYRPRDNSSCIVITPGLLENVRAALPRLQRCTGREPLLLCGGEEEP